MKKFSNYIYDEMLNLEKGIFTPQSECSSASKPLSQYMSDLLAMIRIKNSLNEW